MIQEEINMNTEDQTITTSSTDAATAAVAAKPTPGINGSGVYRWDDPNEINRKLAALTSQPVWEVNDNYYENTILKYYDEKCTRSKAIYEEAKEYIPGGVQHNLAFNKPFPVAFAKASGAHLYD